MLTTVEIDSRAFRYNLRIFRKIIPRDAKFMAVIKGNAYGHGFLEIAKLAVENGEVDVLCVASLSEALELQRAKLLSKPVVVLSFYELDEQLVKEALKAKIVLPLYSLEQLSFLEKVARLNKVKALVHLKIDTGTSRVGILPSEINDFSAKLKSAQNVLVTGVWTHLAASEIDPKRTKEQLDLFAKIRSEIQKTIPTISDWHSNCTAATILHPEGAGRGERVGIGLYGLQPSEKTAEKIVLKPVLQWKTRLVQVKTVPQGAKISYDGTFTTRRETVLGILPVGYYDGFDRRFSNKGKVLIQGQLCPVLGRVCMNLTMVDVTDIPKRPRAGDEVVLIGRQGKATLSADDLAATIGTINYEIVDRINPLLPRIIQ